MRYKAKKDTLDRTNEDVVHRLAANVRGLKSGPIPNRNTQEAKPPAIGFATESMLIRSDQHPIVRDDLEKVRQRGGLVALKLDLHVGADMTGDEHGLGAVWKHCSGLPIKVIDDRVSATILPIPSLHKMVQSIHLEYCILGEHIAERGPIRGIQSNAVIPPGMPNGFEIFQTCNTRHQIVDLVAHMICLTFPSIPQSNAHCAEDIDPRG